MEFRVPMAGLEPAPLSGPVPKAGEATITPHGHIIFNELMERDTRHDLATFGLGSQRSTN